MKELFKKIVSLITVVSLIGLTGCYSVKVLSDRDTPITLASRTDTLPYKESYKVWYVLWGLIPISDNTTNKILATTKLKKVRITTKMDADDWLVSLILGGFLTICTWTVEVEGAE